MQWLPIDENTPKDRRILLLLPGRQLVFGQWNDDLRPKKPKKQWPFWDNDLKGTFGVFWVRLNQPTHWMDTTKLTHMAVEALKELEDGS